MSSVGTIDLGFSGPKYTWSNKRVGWANIRERLDRGICNADWQRLFPKAAVRHLTALTSDHNPIILDTHVDICSGNRPFRFEAMWTKEESSLEVVYKAWSSLVEGSHSFQLAHKIHKIQKYFKVWNKNVFGSVKARIKELEDKIGEI